MKREKSRGLFAAEGLGEGHAVQLTRARRKAAIAVTPRPDGNSSTFAIDVLRALDKRSWASAGVVQKEAPENTALLWIFSTEIEDVFVVNADWMDARQFRFAAEMAERVSVWLLFAGATSDCNLGGTSPRLVPRAVLEAKLEKSPTRWERAPAADWESFPDLPTASALYFRAACADILDETQLSLVERAMRRGADQIRAIIARGGSEEAARALLVAESASEWETLSRARGAQLAAVVHGWRLTFSLDQWMLTRASGGVLKDREKRLLVSLYDPRAAMIYLVARLAPISGHGLSKLTCGALRDGGERVESERVKVELPSDVAEIGRAYFERFTKDQPATAPLFRTATGKQLTPKGASRVVLNSAKVTTLPIPAAGFSSIGKQQALSVEFRRLEAQVGAS